MKETIRIFKALSDPTRLRLFFLLMKRDFCVCELTFILDMMQSRVSHQLRILRDVGLVEDRREGRWIIYTIPKAVKKNISPFIRQAAGPRLAESKAVLKDCRRIDLCLQEDIRKKKIRTEKIKTGRS
jgi:ArsR family transcriptional regulator